MRRTNDLLLVTILGFIYLITSAGSKWRKEVTNTDTGSVFRCEEHDRDYQQAVIECEDKDKKKDGSPKYKLASILSDADNKFVKEVLKTCGGYAWIGLNNKSGEVKWEDGSEVDYTNYKAGYVTFQGDNQCAVFERTTLAWKTLDCRQKKNVLCKRVGSTKTTGEPTTTPVGETPAVKQPSDPRKIADDFLRQEKGRRPCHDASWAYSNLTGYCYMFKSHQKTWTAALLECEAVRGELLEIDDEIDQSFIDEHLMKYNYEDHWLGARRMIIPIPAMSYHWSSKEKVENNATATVQESARWANDEPTRECVYINRADRMAWKWFWKTADCNEKKAVYCRQKATRCPAVPLADHVVPSSLRPNIELTITYQCEAGYSMPDYDAWTQEWLEAQTNPNNTISEPPYKTNPTMNITCDYDVTGGRWTNTSLAVADCLPIKCEPLPVIEFATANITEGVDHEYPTHVLYTCSLGYFFMDEYQRTTAGYCDSKGGWRRHMRATFPKRCDPLPCKSLKPPKNAQMLNGMNTFFAMTIAFSCDAGFMFPDGAVWQFSKCGKRPDDILMGWWNETAYPDCEELSCPAPRQVQHANMSNKARHWKNTIVYNCEPGYEFPDSSAQTTVKCTDQAIWQPQIDDCEKSPEQIPVTGRRYQPEPVEAPQAASIGGTATIICCVMIALVILIDLNSIIRDLKRMRRNLRHLRRRFTNPHLPQPRKMPDEVA